MVISWLIGYFIVCICLGILLGKLYNWNRKQPYPRIGVVLMVLGVLLFMVLSGLMWLRVLEHVS